MADELNEEIEEISEDEFAEDYDASIDEDEDEDAEEEEIEDSPKSKRRKKDNYSDAMVAVALQANPMRQQARRKRISIIEGLVNQNELETDDGKIRAWTTLKTRADQGELPPKNYGINIELKDGDFVLHPNFGQGFVIETLSPTKVSILFEDGLRKLVCNFKRD